MTFDINWWWEFQKEIELQFNFTRRREEVSTHLSSRYFFDHKLIDFLLEGKDLVIIGAGITPLVDIPRNILLAADGAVKACFERDVVPDLIITDMDGYMSDIKWAYDNGSKIIIHVHGDNMTRFAEYSTVINPVCVTSAYPSPFTSCWGGFTDGDRAVMMALALNCNSVKLVGFDFDKVGQYSGEYSSQKLEKLKWARKIINACMKRSQKVSFL